MTTVETILLAPTPAAWVDYAAKHWRELLTDHANCEKKAASTALALMFAYPEDRKLSSALSRLAREELRHFEQVQRMMETLDVPYIRQKPGRYGAGLRAVTRTSDPGRKLDLMLVGALIEARSCERFRLLAPKLPAPLSDFYATLATSEARHFELYLDLASAATPVGVAKSAGSTAPPDAPSTAQPTRGLAPESARRLQTLAEHEAALATTPDPAFRFHSGAPA